MNRSDAKVCRICLKSSRLFQTFSIHKLLSEQNSEVKIQQALNFLVPELYLGVSHDPVICQDCRISLRIAYFFKKTCLETEQVVGNYLKKVCVTGQWINLADVIEFRRETKQSVSSAVQDSLKDRGNVNDQDKGVFIRKNLTFCEQSGLFVDENGCFFNAHGQPVDQSQMEIEKANINEKIDKLFEITSVFSLNEEDGESFDNPTLGSNIDNKDDGNPTQDQPPRSWIKIAPKEKLFGPKTSPQRQNKQQGENAKKRNYVEVDVKETTENGEVNKKMKILNQDILNKIEKIRIPKKKLVVKAKRVSTDVPILYQTEPMKTVDQDGPSRCLIDIPAEEDTPLFTKPHKTVCDLGKPKKRRKRDEEPQDPKENESSSIAEDDDIEKIIKNLHDDGTSHYVDVPEFIQIKQFTMNDLQVLQKDTPAKRNETSSQNSESTHNEKESDGVSIEQPTKPPEIVEDIEKTCAPKVNSCDTGKPLKKIVVGKKTFTPKRLNKGNSGITRINKNLERYSCDGTYIKDHDYLSNPYKLADIIRREGDQIMSFCYICGSLHTLESHVEHMSGHKSFCQLCKKHYGNSFAFNIHVKYHDRSCDWCDALVPYHKRQEHEMEHKNKASPSETWDEESEDQDSYGLTKEEGSCDVRIRRSSNSRSLLRTRSRRYVKYKEDSESTGDFGPSNNSNSVSRKPNWTWEEVKLIKINFGDYIVKAIYPPSSQIKEFIETHHMVRTVSVIKSKIQHLIRKKHKLPAH